MRLPPPVNSEVPLQRNLMKCNAKAVRVDARPEIHT